MTDPAPKPAAEGDAWRIALAALLPRRGLWRLVAGALGLTGIALSSPVHDALAKKKKKKKSKSKAKAKKKPPPPPPSPPCVPKCAGKVCGPNGCGGRCGTCLGNEQCSAQGQCDCVPDCDGKICGSDGCDGSCLPGCGVGFDCTNQTSCDCASAVICDDVCCAAATQVCDAAAVCCSPETENQTCQGKCGELANNCDQPLDCGLCAEQTCQTVTCNGVSHVCDYTDSTDNLPGVDCDAAGEFCCRGNCCGTGEVCFQQECCTPETEAETCAERCGPTTNNCGQEIDCPADCGGVAGVSCNDGICECDNGGDLCDDVCCDPGQVCAAATDTCSAAYEFVDKWGTPDGSSGSNPGEFNFPTNIAVDSDDKVYVSDFFNRRVQKFDNDGTFITSWGVAGNGVGQFNGPRGIVVAANGIVYVHDGNFHEVTQRWQRTSADNDPEVYEFIDQWGSSGPGDNQTNTAVGLARDADGNLYIADNNNHRVKKLTSEGALLDIWGGVQGNADGQFNSPNDVAVHGDTVYVVETNNERVQMFDRDGNFLGKWGDTSGPNAAGQFFVPTGIAVDADGDVYVVDRGNHRIQKFDADGTFITSWGSRGVLDGQFDAPLHVAVDGAGNVYVTDRDNNRVQVFAPVAVAAARLRAGAGVEKRKRSAGPRPAHDQNQRHGQDRRKKQKQERDHGKKRRQKRGQKRGQKRAHGQKQHRRRAHNRRRVRRRTPPRHPATLPPITPSPRLTLVPRERPGTSPPVRRTPPGRR